MYVYVFNQSKECLDFFRKIRKIYSMNNQDGSLMPRLQGWQQMNGCRSPCDHLRKEDAAPGWLRMDGSLVLGLLSRSIPRLWKIRLRVLIQLLPQVVRLDDRRADGCIGPSLERHFGTLFFRRLFRQHLRQCRRVPFPTRIVSAGGPRWEGLHIWREALAQIVDVIIVQRAPWRSTFRAHRCRVLDGCDASPCTLPEAG